MQGQALLETLMLTLVFLGLWLGALHFFQSQQIFNSVFGQPWQRLANEVEFGIPAADRKAVAPLHPTGWERHATRKPTHTSAGG